MLGGLVTPADSMNAILGMRLSIASKLEGEHGECLGGCGVVGSVVRALAAKARGPGFDSRQLPGCFLFQQAF